MTQVRTLEGRKAVKLPESKPVEEAKPVEAESCECAHESVWTVDGCGAFCRFCGETTC